MNKNDFPQNETNRDPQKSTTSSTGTSASSGTQKPAWEGGRREGRAAAQGQVQGDEAMSLDKIRDVGKNLGEQLETQLKERPYVVLGAVAGVGFVAGSLLGSRLGQVAIALAGGYLVRNMIRGGGGDVQRIVKQGIDKLTQERSSG